MNLCFEGYGCTANQGETLELAQRARDLGHNVVAEAEAADTVVLGTCTVIQATADRMEHRLRTLRDQGKRVIVAGCMATADRRRLRARYPETALVAPGDLEGLETLVGRGGCWPAREAAPVSAILPIASGCRGHCTYCATLRARGRVTSRPLIDIVEKARQALHAGSRELLLTSQDNGAYGADTGGSLEALLKALGELKGDFRLRVGMLNPALAIEGRGRPASLVAAWGDERTYKFLHLPIQSGSERMLEAMGRDHDLESFWRVIEAFRSRYPGLMVATDVICGFPGETDEDHQATLALLKALQPEIINITRFSPRPFTPAAQIPGEVPPRLARERSRELTRLRQALSQAKFESRVGSHARVLATEQGKPGTTLCRDGSYRPVVVGRELELGRFYEVELTGATSAYLRGKLVALKVIVKEGLGRGARYVLT